jgi:hypothetical protein
VRKAPPCGALYYLRLQRTLICVSHRRCTTAGLLRYASPCGALYYLWLQRIARLIFCVMLHRGGGGSRRRPCTPGLRPATSPLRGAFDLSLQASGRAEAASVQHGPQPASMRAAPPSGNVSAMLRPPPAQRHVRRRFTYWDGPRRSGKRSATRQNNGANRRGA